MGVDEDDDLNSYIYSGSSLAYTAHGIPLDIECDATSVCWGDWSADGDNLFALYERGAWDFKSPMDPGAKDSGEEVTCASVSLCFGSETLPNGAVEFTVYNGHNWTNATTAMAGDGVNASCAAQNFCISADTNSEMLRFNGKQWLTQSIAVGSGSQVDLVDCASSKFCVALAQNGDDITTTYRYNGTNWQPSDD